MGPMPARQRAYKSLLASVRAPRKCATAAAQATQGCHGAEGGSVFRRCRGLLLLPRCRASYRCGSAASAARRGGQACSVRFTGRRSRPVTPAGESRVLPRSRRSIVRARSGLTELSPPGVEAGSPRGSRRPSQTAPGRQRRALVTSRSGGCRCSGNNQLHQRSTQPSPRAARQSLLPGGDRGLQAREAAAGAAFRRPRGQPACGRPRGAAWWRRGGSMGAGGCRSSGRSRQAAGRCLSPA